MLVQLVEFNSCTYIYVLNKNLAHVCPFCMYENMVQLKNCKEWTWNKLPIFQRHDIFFTLVPLHTATCYNLKIGPIVTSLCTFIVERLVCKSWSAMYVKLCELKVSLSNCISTRIKIFGCKRININSLLEK